MGITGLIPFLEKASKPVHVSQFSGCTVAVDAYCWLHKGAFSCAEKLARGDSCNAYVHYCMKFVNTLLAHNIKPILVFDGRHLPAKSDTEKKRRDNREINRKRAAELMRQDKPDQARTYLRRCIDITHDMALELMKECRARNVDCITAPYEADAQLAYLNIQNIAHIVITEDSDLLLFGCKKVLFKMDMNGGGLLVEQEKLYLAMDVRPSNFSMDKFRHMCILSGCDYLPSLPGIGLAKACRFVKRTADPDIHRALSRLGSHLNMNLVVPIDYRDSFLAAEAMFLHQPVFDPITRQIVPLTPLPSNALPLPLPEKDILSPKKALQLAYGNLDPFTLKVVDDWDPDKPEPKRGKTKDWKAMSRAPHKSIWSADFKPTVISFETPVPPPIKHPSTTGKLKEHKVDIKKLPPSNEEVLASLREQFVCTSTSPPAKKPCLDITNNSPSLLNEPSAESSVDTKHHHNPFSKKLTPIQKTPRSESKFSALSKFSHVRKTEMNDNCIVQSRYFGSSCVETEKTGNDSKDGEHLSNITLLKDIQNIPSSPEKKNNPPQELEKFIKNSASKNNIDKLMTELNKSPIKRKSLFTDQNISVKEVNENESTESDKEKKDFSENNQKNNTCTSTFKWAKSLEEKFGFKTTNIKSSKSVSNEFRNPAKDCLTEPRTESVKTETKQKSKNPFRIVEPKFKFSLGSQGSSCEEDSWEESQTANTSTESLTQEYSSFLKTPSTPAQCRHPGLSKKPNSIVSRQQSLLNMFSFKPKDKLQRA